MDQDASKQTAMNYIFLIDFGREIESMSSAFRNFLQDLYVLQPSCHLPSKRQLLSTLHLWIPLHLHRVHTPNIDKVDILLSLQRRCKGLQRTIPCLLPIILFLMDAEPSGLFHV